MVERNTFIADIRTASGPSSVRYCVQSARHRRNKQFLARLWMVDLTANLKFHVAIDNHDDFIGIANEVFPSPAGRVGP